MKCKVCGKKFIPNAKDMYFVVEDQPVLQTLVNVPKTYECFDCPRCGCQNLAGIRMSRKVDFDDKTEEDQQQAERRKV